ncbi:MAG: NYN domain-containing protein [Candidatus Aenigmatarchaeota archaeon]
MLYENQDVAVFVDVQNMYYSAKNLFNGKVNYSNLLKDAINGRHLIRALAYVIKADTPDESNFFDALENIGYEVKVKELKQYYSGAKKGDWDMGMAIDALKIAPKIDVAVLVTGDGDFKALVEHLQAQGVKVEVMSFGKSTAKELKEEVNYFKDLNDQKDRYTI